MYGPFFVTLIQDFLEASAIFWSAIFKTVQQVLLNLSVFIKVFSHQPISRLISIVAEIDRG